MDKDNEPILSCVNFATDKVTKPSIFLSLYIDFFISHLLLLQKGLVATFGSFIVSIFDFKTGISNPAANYQNVGKFHIPLQNTKSLSYLLNHSILVFLSDKIMYLKKLIIGDITSSISVITSYYITIIIVIVLQ